MATTITQPSPDGFMPRRGPVVYPIDYVIPRRTPAQPITPTPAPTPAPAPALSLPTVTETPMSGNIPPSTDPYAIDDPNTGAVISPTTTTTVVDSITSWIQSNPLLAIALAAGAVWLLTEYFGGSHRRR